jgi:hypothetical protein
MGQVYAPRKDNRMLIANSEPRAARHAEKIDMVLRYLVRENYSDFATLRRLFGFKNHRGLYDLLNKLVSIGALEKHVIGTLRLWQITHDGAAQVSEKPFNRCRLTSVLPLTLRQRLAMQNARLSFEALGATEWLNATDPLFPSAHRPRPDAVVTFPNGQQVAVEIDVTVKTQARYKVLMTHHLIARMGREWFGVFFVLPSECQRNAVRMMIESIKTVKISGHVHAMEKKYHDVFQYVTQEELLNISL